jgi:hypothetical protein
MCSTFLRGYSGVKRTLRLLSILLCHPRTSSGAARIRLAIFVALLCACGAIAQDQSLSTIDLAVQKWEIQYSPGMPDHPDALDGAAGWSFDFPTDAQCPPDNRRCSVHYITTAINRSIDESMTVTLTAQTFALSGRPYFNFALEETNTCEKPATARVMLQRVDDTLTEEFFRWWSNPIAFQLDRLDTETLTVPLTADRWSDVFGRFGNDDAETRAGFRNALEKLGRVGLTFGGGCFFGHGVNVVDGRARFVLREFALR